MRELVEKEVEIGNRDDVDRFKDVYAHDCIHHGIGCKGLDEITQVHLMTKEAFPDLTFKIEDTIIEGDRVVTRKSVKGTHEGVYHGLSNVEFGIQPTGKIVELDVIEIMRIENGKIKEVWALLDQVSLLEQLGVEFTYGG